MKRTFYLLKTLLVAVGLCVGANAWAGDVTTLYERGTTNAWSDSDISAWACSAGTVTIDGGLKNAFGNTGWSGTMSVSPTSNAIVTLTATLQGANTGRAGAYDYIKMGGVSLRLDGQSQIASIDIDGSTTQLATGIARNSTYSIVIIIDTSNGKVSYSYNGGASTVASATTSTAVSNIEIGYHKNGSLPGGTYILKSIEVTNETQDVETANYTINYKAGETTVKTTAGNVAVGTIIPIENSFWASSIKYLKNDGEPSSLTVAKGGSTLDVAVTVASQYTCTVNAKAGETILASPEATVYSGEDAKVFYKKAYKNGVWYITPANGSYPWYAHNFSNVTMNSSYDVATYVANPDVVYFGEVEEMNLSGKFAADGGQTDRYSNGVAKRLYSAGGGTPSSGSWVYTDDIAAGVYTVTMWARNQSGNQTATLPVYLRDSDGNMTDLSTSFDNWAAAEQGEKSVSVTVPDDGKTYSIAIYNYSGYNSNLEMDYVYVTFVRPLSVSKTITSAGWATYCSPYALDFSSSIENLTKAYIVTGATGSTLDLTEITGTIPAETGILLKGEGNVAIPVVASSSTDVSANKLVGKTEEYSLEANGGYVLLDEANGVGFYINPNAAFTVGANTAYLPSNFAGSGSGNARAFYLFDEDATGINAVSTTKAETGDYYNLAGQRVAQPTKGLYIVNGKKYVVK